GRVVRSGGGRDRLRPGVGGLRPRARGAGGGRLAAGRRLGARGLLPALLLLLHLLAGFLAPDVGREDGTELHLRGGRDRLLLLLRRAVRDGDDDVRVALGGHLGAGRALGVDALDADVPGLVELLLGDRTTTLDARLEDELGPSGEVEAELRGPRGVVLPHPVAEGADEDEDADEEPQEDPLGVVPLGIVLGPSSLRHVSPAPRRTRRRRGRRDRRPSSRWHAGRA